MLLGKIVNSSVTRNPIDSNTRELEIVWRKYLPMPFYPILPMSRDLRCWNFEIGNRFILSSRSGLPADLLFRDVGLCLVGCSLPDLGPGSRFEMELRSHRVILPLLPHRRMADPSWTDDSCRGKSLFRAGVKRNLKKSQ